MVYATHFSFILDDLCEMIIKSVLRTNSCLKKRRGCGGDTEDVNQTKLYRGIKGLSTGLHP